MEAVHIVRLSLLLEGSFDSFDSFYARVQAHVKSVGYIFVARKSEEGKRRAVKILYYERKR